MAEYTLVEDAGEFAIFLGINSSQGMAMVRRVWDASPETCQESIEAVERLGFDLDLHLVHTAEDLTHLVKGGDLRWVVIESLRLPEEERFSSHSVELWSQATLGKEHFLALV